MDMDCEFCWHNNATYNGEKAQLENPKYCKLYEDYKKDFGKETNNFEDCKTLYTKCDYNLEQNVHEYIIKLEKLLKDHEQLSEKELKMQNILINDMWIQSQRYLILRSGGVCVKPYPEIVSLPVEMEALCTFHSNLNKVHKSNCLLSQSLENIRLCHKELNRCCEQLDNTIESPFVDGNYSLKSLSYLRNILNDLISYYYCQLCRLKCWSQLLDPGDSVAIEDYMNLIKCDKETDLVENLNSCYCLRSKKEEWINEHKTN